MRHASSWMGKVAALAVVALVGVAVMWTSNGTGEPVAGSALTTPICATGPEGGFEAAQPDFSAAVEAGGQAGGAEPVAICKLMPECWSNSDCDPRCGAGLGKCIHSKCPVRICVCR